MQRLLKKLWQTISGLRYGHAHLLDAVKETRVELLALAGKVQIQERGIFGYFADDKALEPFGQLNCRCGVG